MSASGDGTDWVSRLNDVSQINDLDSALTRLLFLPIAAFFVQAANAVEAISRVVIDPVDALATGVQSFVISLLGGSADIVQSGADTTAADVSVFGIGAFPIALGIVFVSAFILANYLEREESSDLIPFTFTDIPLVGVDEDTDND
jgi:hypothetical protein